MEATAYKCPTCSASLTYNIEIKSWKCDYCSRNYSLDDLSEAERKFNEFSNKETIDVDEYTCSSCGAKIITDENTTATFCAYCGNTAIIKNRVTGVLKPDKVIPFKISKEKAVEAFINCKIGKAFVPNSFAMKEQIEKIRGVYVPFWLHSGNVKGEVKFNAIENKTEKSYELIRAGRARYKDLPTDASVCFDDTMMDGLEPFDFNELQDFNMGYLSGFFAEKYNVNKDEMDERIKDRIEDGIADYLESRTGGYDIKGINSREIIFNISSSEYILLPVWVLNVNFNENKYLFVMNGQTGKFIGDMPVNNKKMTKSIVKKFLPAVILWVFLILFQYDVSKPYGHELFIVFVMISTALLMLIYKIHKESYSSYIKTKNSNMTQKNGRAYLYKSKLTKSVDKKLGF